MGSETKARAVLRPEEAKALANWIAAQPQPRPTDAQAMRTLIRMGLEASGFSVPAANPESLDDRIERVEKRLSRAKTAAGPPSPATGMQMLRRGLAENKLRGLKNRKIRSEGVK